MECRSGFSMVLEELLQFTSNTPSYSREPLRDDSELSLDCVNPTALSSGSSDEWSFIWNPSTPPTPSNVPLNFT